MSEPREKVDISDLKDNFLECPVCVEHFNQTDKHPRLLKSCLHAFCTQCLEQLLLKEKKDQITCPLCRQIESIKGGVHTLPLDVLRCKLIDYAHIKDQKKCPCTDCPDGNDAESRCQECSLYLCKECAYVHKRHKLTNDHSLMPLDEVLEQPLKTLSKGHFCKQHPKRQLEFYCVTDESLCCITCSILGHKGHVFQSFEETVQIKQQELESSLQNLRTFIRSQKETHQRQTDRKANIQHSQAQAKVDVSNLFTKLQQLINDRKEAILKDIATRSSALLSSCEKNIAALEQNLATTESYDTYYKQAKEHSDAVEILQLYPSLKRSLEGSTSDIVQDEELVCNETKYILLKFEPFLVSAIEKILPEIGHITDPTEAAADEEVKSKTRTELMTRIFKEEEQGAKCSSCQMLTDGLQEIRCGHVLCPRCFDTKFKETKTCPNCNRNCTVQTGQMPPGTMVPEIGIKGLPGYEGFSSIKIHYSIRDGLQENHHPRPGKRYTGVNTTAYLPANPEGRKVLVLLMLAWKRRLTFQITSTFLRSDDYLDFGIPHWIRAESRNPNYLRIVQEKLADLGVTEDDIGPP